MVAAAEHLVAHRVTGVGVADDEARWLVDDSGTERAEDAPPAAVRRLAAVPVADPAPPAAPADEVYDREADEAAADRAQPAPQAVTARPARRPAVPSFDDIMFGPRKRD